MAVTLADVARASGVTTSIVSRVLNGDPTLRVRPETRQRVLAKVRELDYSPNVAARSLRTARTGAIGLIVPDVTNPIYAEILHGAEARARTDDHAILLGSADDLGSTGRLYTDLVRGGRIDGVLLQRMNDVDDETLRHLVMGSDDVPTVLMNSRLDGLPGSVILDDAAGARTATEHLLAAGHRRIAHIGGPAIVDSAQRRRDGFIEAMVDTGNEPPPAHVVMAGYTVETGHRAMVRLLALKERPTGIVVANLTAATGALRAAKEAGVRVPHDVSVVAIHEAWFAAHTDPPLTTIRMPLRELGDSAVRAVLNRLDGGGPADEVVDQPPPRVIVRASTAPR